MKHKILLLFLVALLATPNLFANGYRRSNIVTVYFPELNIRCLYGSCRLRAAIGAEYGTEKCIVRDTNEGMVIVEGLLFGCGEFIGKTIIWKTSNESLVGQIVSSTKTY